LKRLTYIPLIITLLIGLSSVASRSNQITDTRSVVKAMYIYTFATLVEWPAERRTGDFIIGVYGEKTAVYDELIKKYAGKSIGSQKIVVKNFRNKAEVKSCHILYVTEERTNELTELSASLSTENTLLVGERSGALSKGAIINFIIEGNQQKYEINKTNARNHKLVIADKLSDLAASVTR